jgi:hypothetical protein
VGKHPYDRPGDPEKPSVVRDEWGEWWAQVCNADEFPEGYMCRNGKTQQEALARVPELMEALRKRKEARSSVMLPWDVPPFEGGE